MGDEERRTSPRPWPGCERKGSTCRPAAGRHHVPSRARAGYDVALCMYHDQALIR